MDNVAFDLTQWLQSAANTYLNFSSQVLGMDDFLTGDDLIIGQKHEAPLPGSSLTLTVYEHHKIQVKILAEENVWSDIARTMLGITQSELVSKEDMQDAAKEIANIVAGGVKSHLNSIYENSILLSLPEYIEQDELTNESNTLWGKIAIHTKEVFIKIHVIPQANENVG